MPSQPNDDYCLPPSLSSCFPCLPKAAYTITLLCLLHRPYGLFLIYILFQDNFTVKSHLQKQPLFSFLILFTMRCS